MVVFKNVLNFTLLTEVCSCWRLYFESSCI